MLLRSMVSKNMHCFGLQVIAQNFGTHIIAEWVQIGIFPHCEASTGAKMLLSNFEFGQNRVCTRMLKYWVDEC